MNIFIIHTPLQLSVAELLVQTLPQCKTAPNILFIEEKGASPYRSPRVKFDAVYPIHFLASRKLLMARKIFEPRRKLQENMATIRQVIAHNSAWVFISDISWLTNNRVFFDTALKRQCRFAMFDEGLGIYMNCHMGIKAHLKNLTKIVLKFKPYHLKNEMGNDHPRIERIYAFRPEYVWGADQPSIRAKLRIIELPEHDDVDWHKERLLFLEQPFWLLTKTPQQWDQFTDAIISKLKAFGSGEVYVKPHHQTKPAALEAYRRAGFQIMDTASPAEEVIAEYGFTTVVSLCSSALTTIRNFHPTVRTVSILLRRMEDEHLLRPRHKIYESCLDLFGKFGVEVKE